MTEAEGRLRCVVAGGAGAVGRMFAGLLAAAGAEVCTVDTAPPGGPAGTAGPPPRQLRGDITAPDAAVRAELAAADVVLLALPERVALDAVAVLADAVRPDALLAETLSVKSSFSEAVRSAAPGHQAVGLNPMFAPSLGLPGRPVAAVVHRDGPLAARLLDIVRQGGGRVVTVAAAEHDRLAAASQALTHAAVLSFGAALAELDVDIETLSALAPPPHATLLALLARIAGGTPEVYWDVQAGNPLAREARQALASGLARLDGLADPDRLADPAAARAAEAEFAGEMGRIREVFGKRLEPYGELCAGLFAQFPQPGPEQDGPSGGAAC
ncbi:prephenate dehydrogenase/arogenate dehydrogenase family protein [Streptomyces sp. NPDC053542]|uniref:prephenate dehydrogenase/arogenate dehydrogenase family protein n=1 Tax=Streptomyces sp. NPDC053542 TaxID=3365710 RepID=UPI0037D45415